jgi:hypothetical protein
MSQEEEEQIDVCLKRHLVMRSERFANHAVPVVSHR